MRFFLDENFPKKAASYLEAQGHEVFDVRGTQNEGISDQDIFALARNESAIFLTSEALSK